MPREKLRSINAAGSCIQPVLVMLVGASALHCVPQDCLAQHLTNLSARVAGQTARQLASETLGEEITHLASMLA